MGWGGSKGETFPLAGVVAAGVLVGVVFTWPLAGHFFAAIPYSLRPLPGFEKVPLMPGDHLSSYYWFWLFSDNLFGASGLFTNPYEFNSATGLQSAVYANFPLSLLYVLLLPLGPVGAYNALVFLSFALSALAAALLAWSWTRDRWAALAAGLVFAAVPYRVSHVAGGQVFGHAVFLLPLCLFLVEKGLSSGKRRFGWAAGACLLLMAVLEHHTAYLTVLTLGVYLPSRLLLFGTIQRRPQGGPPLGPGLAGALAGGFSLSLWLWVSLGGRAGLPLWDPRMLQPFLLGTLSVLLGWLYLSALFARCTLLSYAEARDRIGRLMLLLTPLLLMLPQYWLRVPRLGIVLAAGCAVALAVGLAALFAGNRDRSFNPDSPAVRRTLLGLGICLALAAAYLMYVRSTVLLPSVAGKGRSLNEVLLFSPKWVNLFSWVDVNRERYVQLGWVLPLLAALGLLPLLRRAPANPGLPATAGVIGFLAVVLTPGPTLSLFPIYRILYDYFPFFNYPRVPGRFVMVGVLFLSLLAALALASFREWCGRRGFVRAARWVPAALLAALAAGYHTYQPMGLCLMPADNRVFEEIPRRLPEGRMVLELPLWPGVSHQSSTYEYTVTRTRRPMINGYAPVVFREYLDEVFWPLYPLDHGELAQSQATELERNRVSLVTFHDDPLVYTAKVSPFPPRLALKRLTASPRLELLARDGDLHLFGVRQSPGGGEAPAPATSPVQAVFYPADLPAPQTGRLLPDPQASGYHLLLDERALERGEKALHPGAAGNVVTADPERDSAGLLLAGSGRFLPSGRYRARFRLQAGAGSPEHEAARLEITGEREAVLAARVVRAGELMPFDAWLDVPLEFEIAAAALVGFRVRYSGAVPLRANLVLIGFADQQSGPGAFEAEDLLRQTGTVVDDALASGSEAVLGRGGYHPRVYLSHGPYRTFEPGAYRAEFFLRRRGGSAAPGAEIALVEVATDLGKRVFGSRSVPAGELAEDAYRPIAVEFEVPFRCELDLRVRFLGGADLLVDRIAVAPSPRRVGGR